MGTYDRQIASVKRIIAKKGQTATFKHVNDPIILDANKPWEKTDVAPSIQDIKMIFLSPSATGDSQLMKELLQYLSGTTIASGVIRGFCASFEFVPKLNDIFIRDGNELVVKAVDTLAPNGQLILHTVEFDV